MNFPGDLKVTIDGNIGAGKTSVIELLSTKYYLPVHPEPVEEEWKDYLTDIYDKVIGAGFEFQIKVWLDRVLNIRPGVTERSGYFQYNVFSEVSYDIQSKSKKELIRSMYADENVPKPNLMIYLRSNPEKCKERINKRGRGYEEYISLGYLRRLHELHEVAYESAARDVPPVRLINVEDKTLEVITDEVFRVIDSFLRE